MHVLALGGTGRYGQGVLPLLARSAVVTDLVVAGRRLEAAERAAAACGTKARPAQVELHDAPRLHALLAGCDLVVNLSGPFFETLLPVLQAAIATGTHYCDISEGGRIVQQGLQLDAAARAAGITALLGIGYGPGMTNLLAKYACQQLDTVEAVQICGIAITTLAGWRSSAMLSVLEAASGQVPTYRNGVWVEVAAHEHGIDVTTASGDVVRAYPSGMAEPVTLPRYLPGVPTVTTLYGFLPARVSDLFWAHVRRITSGEFTVPQAFASLYAALDAEPVALPVALQGKPSPGMVVTAQGQKDGQSAVYSCRSAVRSTEAAVATAALKILRGEIGERGVIPPEACLDPWAFLTEVVGVLPEANRPADGHPIIASLVSGTANHRA